jgi:hypothetical protein
VMIHVAPTGGPASSANALPATCRAAVLHLMVVPVEESCRLCRPVPASVQTSARLANESELGPTSADPYPKNRGQECLQALYAAGAVAATLFIYGVTPRQLLDFTARTPSPSHRSWTV